MRTYLDGNFNNCKISIIEYFLLFGKDCYILKTFSAFKSSSLRPFVWSAFWVNIGFVLSIKFNST